LYSRGLSRVRSGFAPTPRDATHLQVEEVERFDERVNLFWDEVRDHHDFIVQRDMKYLNWRYCDPRPGSYTIKQVRDGERVLGYCVLSTEERAHSNYRTGQVVDLLALPGRLDVVNVLVKDAARFFSASKVELIHCLLVKSHPYSHVLEQHGFAGTRSDFVLVYRAVQPTVHDEIDKLAGKPYGRVHLCYGDFP
jgi:hypothetical protein